MRDGAEHPRPHRRREPDALAEEPLERIADLEAESADVDLNEVRLDLLEVDRDACLVQPLAEAAGARVILREPLDVVVERVDAGRGDDPRLAHRSAELMLVPPRAQHSLRRPGDDRAERAAEPLREADRDRVRRGPRSKPAARRSRRRR